MPLWAWILTFAALVKLPIAGLMLWIPIRNDEAMRQEDVPDSSEEDGGSKVLPGGPLDPHPRTPRPPRPRRGPHGSASPPAPRRVRTRARSTRRVGHTPWR
ncbi:MAG TPA: hypothetical protein VKG62_01090 [Solirubrobacteraceae bacterium]|nr:hypothetical protein [Solirubrobacteraceae bacterium]